MAQTSQAKDSNQSDKKNTRAKQTSPSSQVAGPVGETLGPVRLEAALADPLSASPGQIMQLQRQYGNRAIQRLISTGPGRCSTAGPDWVGGWDG